MSYAARSKIYVEDELLLGFKPHMEIYRVNIGDRVFVGTSQNQKYKEFLTKMLDAVKLYRDHKELFEALASYERNRHPSDNDITVQLLDIAHTAPEAFSKFYNFAKDADIPFNPLKKQMDEKREEENLKREKKLQQAIKHSTY